MTDFIDDPRRHVPREFALGRCLAAEMGCDVMARCSRCTMGVMVRRDDDGGLCRCSGRLVAPPLAAASPNARPPPGATGRVESAEAIRRGGIDDEEQVVRRLLTRLFRAD